MAEGETWVTVYTHLLCRRHQWCWSRELYFRRAAMAVCRALGRSGRIPQVWRTRSQAAGRAAVSGTEQRGAHYTGFGVKGPGSHPDLHFPAPKVVLRIREKKNRAAVPKTVPR